MPHRSPSCHPPAARIVIPLGLVAAVLGVFAWLQALQPAYFLWDDNAAYYLPVFTYDAETLFGEGRLAHLNPHQYLGQTHLASGQSGVLYPPVYLAYLLSVAATGDPRGTVDALAALHLVAAALGFLILARRLGTPPPIAALGGLAWATFPFVVVVGRSWIFVTAAAAFLPWMLWTLDRLLEGPSLRRTAAFAGLRALFFLQGYAQYVVLGALYEIVFVALGGGGRAARSAPWARLGRTAGGWALAAGLAAPLLVPMLHAKEVSAARSAALSRAEFLSNALDPEVFLRAQVWAADEDAVHRSSGAIFHVGWPLLLAAAAVGSAAARRLFRAAKEAGSFGPSVDRTVLAGIATGVLALVLSTEAAAILHGVPVLSSFRWPFKGFLVALFFVVVAVVAGGSPSDPGRLRRAALFLVLTATLAGNLAVLSSPDLSRPFGPNRLDREVATFREEAARRIDPARGRVVSMWVGHGYPALERFLTHQWATLAGANHLGGYDPLVAAKNLELAAGLEYSNIWRYELTPESLAHLSEWSVRWLLAPDTPRVRAAVAPFPQVRESRREGDLVVFENLAALPLAYFAEEGRAPVALPVVADGRGLGIETGGRGGLLRIQTAPLPWLRAVADGSDLGRVAVDPSDHVVVEVPAGTRTVRLRYVDLPFRLGLAIAVLTALGLLFAGTRIAGPSGGPAPGEGAGPRL